MAKHNRFYMEALKIFAEQYGTLNTQEMAVKRDLMIVARIFNKTAIELASDVLRLRLGII